MIFLLDTNAVRALASEDLGFMERRLGYSPDDFAVSAIVAFEIQFGGYKAGKIEHTLSRFERLQLAVLPFDENDAREAGRIRAELQRQGTPIGPYDVLIAGQALARELTLITRNVREFSRVAGLRVENWME